MSFLDVDARRGVPGQHFLEESSLSHVYVNRMVHMILELHKIAAKGRKENNVSNRIIRKEMY